MKILQISFPRNSLMLLIFSTKYMLCYLSWVEIPLDGAINT